MILDLYVTLQLNSSCKPLHHKVLCYFVLRSLPKAYGLLCLLVEEGFIINNHYTILVTSVKRKGLHILYVWVSLFYDMDLNNPFHKMYLVMVVKYCEMSI